jgi:metal-sulfur cluster biosynthetic enzyme
MGKITSDDVYKALAEVYDPEIPINIVDLGLIYKVEVDDDNNVDIDMTFTTKSCPMHILIREQAQASIKKINGIGNVNVNLVWEPQWTPEMISKEVGKKISGEE